MREPGELEISDSTQNKATPCKGAKVNHQPPDGGWGWLVLLGTVYINVVLMGHCKSFGVYFRSFMDEFDASPSRISWLYSLQLFIFSFFSPFSSILVQLVSPRKIALVGSLLAFSALVLSSFAPSLNFLYVYFGIMQGAALTLSFTAGITVVAEYFHRYRGLANGLMMAGNALGGIIMPLLVQFLLSKYALRGCLLIMGSLSLSSSVGAMLWQPVKWHLKKSPMFTTDFEENCIESFSRKSSCVSYIQEKCNLLSGESSTSKSNEATQHKTSSCGNLASKSDKIVVPQLNLPVVRIDKLSNHTQGANLYSSECQLKIPVRTFTQGGSQPLLPGTIQLNKAFCSCDAMSSAPKISIQDSKQAHSSRLSSFLYLSSLSLGPAPDVLLKKEHIRSSPQVPRIAVNNVVVSEKPSRWTIFRCFSKIAVDPSIFRNRRFYLLTTSLFFHSLGYQGTYLLLPHRATMLGLAEAQAASVLSILALADLIGRISCAWISDYHLCPRQYLFACGMFLSGVVAFGLPFCETHAVLVLTTATFGFCCGSYIGLVVALFADTYCSEHVALAYSIAVVVGSSMSLGGGPLMCYVLESTGSYTICQAILGLAQLSGSIVWVAEPWISSSKSQKNENFQT